MRALYSFATAMLLTIATPTFAADLESAAPESVGMSAERLARLDPVRRGNLGSPGEFGWSGAAFTHVLIDPKEDLDAISARSCSGAT